MSSNDRQVYQRLLAAYSRRQQILATCDKILKLCEICSADASTMDREDPMEIVSDYDFSAGFDDAGFCYDEEEETDPHYFSRSRAKNVPALEESSFSKLDFCQASSHVKHRQDITCRPYIGFRARSLISERIMASSCFQNGDVIHAAFSPAEMRVMIESAEEYGGVPNCQEVAKLLRGRTASDVQHAWIDYVLNIGQTQSNVQVHDEFTSDLPAFYFNTSKALQRRSPLIVRESEQFGETRARVENWMSRQGYIHAECTFRIQLEDALNQIVTGPSEDTSHLAVIVGSGNIREGAKPPIALDLRDKSTYPLAGHNGIVTEASFSSDGRYIITGSDDKTFCLYSSDSLQLRHTSRTSNAVIHIASHKSEPVFAIASSNANSILTVNAESLVAHSARLQFEDTVLDFSFGASGTSVQNHLVVGFQNQTSVYKYQLTSTGLRRVTQIAGDNKVFLVRSIPSTATAYASCFFYSTETDDQQGSDKIKIWDARDPHIRTVTIRTFTKRGKHTIGDMSISPDGRYLQTSGTDSCVCINDLRRLGSKPLLVLKHQCDIGQPTDGVATEWSRDSRFVVTGADDCTVRVWGLYNNDYEADDAGLLRVIDGNAGGEGCIHIVANINDSNGFIYGTKLGHAVAFEQYRCPPR